MLVSTQAPLTQATVPLVGGGQSALVQHWLLAMQEGPQPLNPVLHE